MSVGLLIIFISVIIVLHVLASQSVAQARIFAINFINHGAIGRGGSTILDRIK